MAKHTKVTALVTFLVICAICSITGAASADSIGQCNLFPGDVAHSVSQWKNGISQEGVLVQADEQVFSNAGHVSFDQTVQQWIGERVVMGASHNGFTGKDFGCQNGTLFNAGNRHYAPGTKIFFSLPMNMSKSQVHLHKSKTYSEAYQVHVTVVGLVTCFNPNLGKTVVIMYRKPRHHKKPHHPVVHTQSNECHAGQVIASNGNCVNQSQTSTQTCGNGQVMSSTGCVTVQIQVVCGIVTIGGSTEGNEVCKTEVHEERKEEHKEEHKESPPPFLEIKNLQKLQETFVGREEVICVSVYSLPGDKLHIAFEAEFGKFTNKVFEKEPNRFCDLYIAPTEPLFDEYWVTVVDESHPGLHQTSERWRFQVMSEEEQHFYSHIHRA